MIKSYFGINFDAIVVAILFTLIFFFIIYKFKIVELLAEKIIYPIIKFFIDIYNFINNVFNKEKITPKTNDNEKKVKSINKIEVSINKLLSLISDWFSKGIIWKFIFIIYIPFLSINYLLISKTASQMILPLNLNNILNSFGATSGAIVMALILSFLLVPLTGVKFKKSFPLCNLFFLLTGLVHFFF